MKEQFVIATRVKEDGTIFTTKHSADEVHTDRLYKYTVVANIDKMKKGKTTVGKNPNKAQIAETKEGLYAIYADWSAVKVVEENGVYVRV